MLFETAQPNRASAKQQAILRYVRISVLVALVLAALIGIGIGVRQNLSSRLQVRIRGSLSEADRVDILRLVRRDLRQRAFPGLSWRTIRMAPLSIYRLGTARISEVLLSPQPSPYSIQVAGKFGAAKRYWLLKRGPKGWAIESERATPWFDVFEGRVEDLVAGFDHGKVQAPPLRLGPQEELKEVPMLFLPQGVTLPRRPAKDFDGGASFTTWTSNHAGLSLEGSR